MLIDEANRYEDSYCEEIEVVSNCDDIQVVSPSSISNTMSVLSAEIMTKFRKLVPSSIDDLLDNVFHASFQIEFGFLLPFITGYFINEPLVVIFVVDIHNATVFCNSDT